MVFNIVGKEFSKLQKYDDLIAVLDGEEDAVRAKALAQSGLTQKVYEYVTSLGVSSAAEMTFAQKLRLSTIAIKEQAIAWATSPLGIATMVAVGIFAIVKAVDYFSKSLERSREKLAELKEEFNTTESELSSLNDELATTQKRISELQSLGELTFTEAEELTNLQKQNNELARQIALLETKNRIKSQEVNAAFVEVMDKDIQNDDNFSYEFGGAADRAPIYIHVNEGRYLDSIVFERRAEIVEQLNGYLDDDARAGLEYQLEAIDKYLQEKSQDFEEYAADVEYIRNPTTDDDKKVNEWLDFISDFQDRWMISQGTDGARTNAFNRLISNEFSDETADLKELGRQGKVTAQSLEDPKYDTFIEKCIKLGIITEESADSLYFLALGFNELKDEESDSNTTTEETQQRLESLEDALKRIDEVASNGQSSISSLSDALSKLRNGTLTLSDVVDLLQDFPGLAPYIDLEAEGYGELQEGLTEMIKESYRQTEVELRALKLSGDLSKEDAEAVDSMREAIERLANEALSDVIPRLDGFAKSLSKIEGVSSGLDMLGEVYWDVKDGKTFDWSSILNNEAFAEAFGGLGDAYNDFIRTIASSSNDIDACQNAFDNLASAYIRNSDALESVTEETKDATVAMLEQMGIANAAAIVEAQLAYNNERAMYATEAYTNASYEQVVAWLQEAEAGSIAKQVLAELAVQKWAINAESIETASDISELISLAETANATATSMERLLKIKELLSEAEYHKSEADSIGNRTDIDYKFHINQYSKYLRDAQELLNAPLEYEKFDFGQFDISYTGSLNSKSSTKSDNEETWFEKQYKYHKHLLEMDKESVSDYLDWLDGAYKQAYAEGIIELDDYYSYQEEVYKGTQDLFKDHLNDIDHEISLLEGTVGSSDEVIALAAQAMADIEKELEAARAAGLDENDDYIQYLKQQWANYSKTVIDLREQAETEAKSSIDRLVDYRIDMLKQEIENEKDALDEKLDNLREFYDKQRKMLQDQYDEEKYLEEQKEKRKSVSDIEAELAMLKYDDSAWAQKRKRELQEQLADAQKDLLDFEKDHALDMTLDMLDEQQAAQEAQIQAQMDALDEKLNDPHALFNQALEDIKNNTDELYKEFVEYNRKYGDGRDSTIVELWEEAYKADLEYQDTHNGKHPDGIEIGNYTGYKIPETQAPPDTPKDDAPAGGQSNGNPYGNVSDVSGTLKYGSKGDGVRALQHALNSLGHGNSGTQSLDGSFGRRTENAVKAFQKATGLTQDGRVGRKTKAKFKEKGYASGTENATPGIHAIEEFGPEYIFTSPSDGTRYRMFTGGEKVLNAEATNFLYDFATTGGGVLTKMLADLLSLSGFGSIAKPVQAIEVNSGDIIIQGNADMKTVSEIRRAQRENLEFIIKEFNKLNK